MVVVVGGGSGVCGGPGISMACYSIAEESLPNTAFSQHTADMIRVN